MKQTSAQIAYAAGEFFKLAFLALVPPFFVYIDVVVMKNAVGEVSLTELTQETLLLVTASIFWYGAWRHPNLRGFLTLVAGFFSCAVIRELDVFFDLIWHGFWVWPIILTSSVTIAYVIIFCRNTTIGPMSSIVGTRSYFYIMFGLVVLLVFSRVFGSGTLFWNNLLGAGYTHLFKTALQEGLELFGYLFVFYGSLVFVVKRLDL